MKISPWSNKRQSCKECTTDNLFVLVTWVEHEFFFWDLVKKLFPQTLRRPSALPPSWFHQPLWGFTGTALFDMPPSEYNPLSQRQGKRHHACLYMDWSWPTQRQIFTFSGSTMMWHVPWTSGSIPMTPKFVGSSMRAVSFCPHLHNNYS